MKFKWKLLDERAMENQCKWLSKGLKRMIVGETNERKRTEKR